MKMKKRQKKSAISAFHKLAFLIKKYYFLLIIIGCVGFVGMIIVYKLYVKKPTYIYARVKVSQGFWWATTQKPNLWFVRAIQKAKEEKNIQGDSLVKILRVAYYPWYGSSQFDVFVTVRLQVTQTANRETYNFKRETIGVSSPIDFEFSNVQFSGTIIALSEKPFIPNFTEKTIILTKKYAYPWEFDEIKVGDYFDDGNGKVLEILEKAKGETNEAIQNEQGGLISLETETYRYIFLKAKVRLREENSIFLYGEEIVVSPGRIFGFVTNGFTFNDYVISKVE